MILSVVKLNCILYSAIMKAELITLKLIIIFAVFLPPQSATRNVRTTFRR